MVWNLCRPRMTNISKSVVCTTCAMWPTVCKTISAAIIAGPARVINSRDIVVVAQTMGPADLMDYDYNKIRGLIIEDGTPTMHVAIVAKALNIPVIAKIKGVFNDIKTGDNLAVDGNEGYVYINPNQSVLEKFRAKIAEKQKLLARLAELKKLPSKPLTACVSGYISMSACLLIWTILKPPTATASVCIVPKFLLWLPM